MRSPLNILLILLAAAGGAVLVHLQSRVTPLRVEHARLSAKYPTFKVANPDNYHLAHLEAGDPMIFMWRCHVPGGNYERRTLLGRSGNTTGYSVLNSPSTGLHWIAFELGEAAVSVRWKYPNGHSSMKVFQGAVADFIAEHWERLDFEALGRGRGVVEVPPDQVLKFLAVRIPPTLFGELQQQVGLNVAEEYMQQPLLEFRFGTPEAFAAAESKR